MNNIDNIKEEIRKWQFATCPTEEKEPFYWKWTDEGLNSLARYIQSFLQQQQEIMNKEILKSIDQMSKWSLKIQSGGNGRRIFNQAQEELRKKIEKLK